MDRLASPIGELKPHYDVVVVGSGYGGGISASRLSRAGKRVCVLERGKERHPGEYPNTGMEAAAELRVDLNAFSVGPRTALCNLHVGNGINVFVGGGLGGTSLINASVAIRPDPRLFQSPLWPKALRDDLGRLEAGYQRAAAMLGSNPYPASFPALHKLTALESCAKAIGGKFMRPDINVTFKDGINEAGVEQKACNLCGDCASGCNYGSKNTILMNYLPDAKRHGAELFVEVGVNYLSQSDGAWTVQLKYLGPTTAAPPTSVSADLVILAAGTLGSTEILLRSRAHGLALSNQLGARFSGNGDVLGFSYNGATATNAIGRGTRPPEPADPIGPCITGLIDLRDVPDVNHGIVIEDAVAPGALGPAMPLTLAASAAFNGKNTAPQEAFQQGLRAVESLFRGPYFGAVQNTETFLTMSHDTASGKLDLKDDRLQIDWPTAGKDTPIEYIDEKMQGATAALHGIYTRDPIVSKYSGYDMLTAHPLGGCVMADSAEGGVVDDQGRVFAGASGAAVHPGLHVLDGAIVPMALGVNPSLTISALTERACAILSAARGWAIDYAPTPPLLQAPPLRPLALRFTEKMSGHYASITPGTTGTHAEAAAQGEREGTAFTLEMTIATDDLAALLAEPAHEAAMIGTVTAPALSPAPLEILDGRCNVLVEEPGRHGRRVMKYRLRLATADGRQYLITGDKTIDGRMDADVWRDATTIRFDIHTGGDAGAPLTGMGLATVAPGEFLRQLSTIDVFGARSADERLEATAQFGHYYAGELYDHYGGVQARPGVPLRKRRPLRGAPPEIHPLFADDGARLLLKRHHGGGKGPVLLAHDLGVSSRIFSIDTADTSLLEYLVAHDFDVWLFDHRASIDLPLTAHTADDVALRDFPAAVELVRRVAGAPSVQVVAHGYGAAAFSMAMLGGLEGVRGAVCSQVATHFVVPRFELFEAYLRVPVAHSMQVRDDQLGRYTREALPELTGFASLEAMENLALLVRRGELVDRDGEDVYLPRLDRLAIPLRLLSGELNESYLPASTERSFEALTRANDATLYSRRVIPGYGHLDCIIGDDAVTDVFPLILEHLDPPRT